MTHGVKLGLPIDIPWERVCVTRDMLDDEACDPEFPPKWHSSIAVFRFVPEEEYQQFPDYEISYLKVAVTVTGYQPHDKEIEGEISWDDLNVETIAEVEALLDEYHPCTGAIVQVAIEPKGESAPRDPREWPFFMDFEPKKRELFEMATDTKERVSRSLENLTIGKSAGTTDSTEVLDVDMGGSTSVGVSIPDVGGLNFASSSQGQWGTKTVGTHQSGVIRTAEQSQEKREGQSFTTNISQLYHLLDSYHLGTNRVVFFIQPRPHVLEAPSGFVRGPRPVDGFQEFFLVVAKPKAQEDYCVSVRLDTAHLAEIDIMEFDYRKDSFELSTRAAIPARGDPNAQFVGYRYIDVTVPLYGKIGERRYRCLSRTGQDTETYVSPWSAYVIDVADEGGYVITSQSASHGTHSIQVAPDGESLAATVTASSHRCYNDGGTFCVDCPDYLSSTSYSGYSNLGLRVNLVSREAIKKVGTDQVLLLTTRGLCCCPSDQDDLVDMVGIVGHRPLTDVVAEAGSRHGLRVADVSRARGDGEDAERGLMAPRAANALGDLIRAELQRAAAVGQRRKDVRPFLLSDFFTDRLERRLRRHGATRARLQEPLGDLLGEIDPRALEKYSGRAPEQITRREVIGLSGTQLAQATNLPAREAARVRLGALGLRLARGREEDGDGEDYKSQGTA